MTAPTLPSAATPSAFRTRAAAPEREPSRRRRPRPSDAAVWVVAVGVVAGGTWGVLAPRDLHPAEHGTHAGALATLDLPDGSLHVEGVVDKRTGHTMPGMSSAEDVPEGLRRFSVTVTLAADDGEELRYTRRDFTVSGPGVKPVVPVSGQIKDGTLQAGTAVSGGLTFDVPEESTQLALQFRGGQTVALPGLPAADTGQHGAEGGHQADAGHAGHGAPGSGEGTGEAPVAPPGPAAGGSDHEHAPGAPPHGH